MRKIKYLSACLVLFHLIVVETNLNSHLTKYSFQISTKYILQFVLFFLKIINKIFPKVYLFYCFLLTVFCHQNHNVF